MAYITFVITLYYNVIIAWALYYFAKSLTSDLPWDKCREYFAGDCKKLLKNTNVDWALCTSISNLLDCTDDYNGLTDRVFSDAQEGLRSCNAANQTTAKPNGVCVQTVNPYTDGV